MALDPRRPDVEYFEQPCKSALNRVRGMPFDWSLNPYMGCEHRCAFCYVRAFEKRADRPSDSRYGRTVRVKTNVASVLRQEFRRRGWRREPVAIGAATDPYQPAEGRYRLTRACLEAFADFHNPGSLITRGPLIVRDVDVLTHLARRAPFSVHVSIPTLDHDVWRRTEPGTAPPAQRLRALERLARAGIKASVAMAPILPGLSDRPEQLAAVVKAAREAGAAGVWAGLLYLREGTREHFLETLAEHWPEQLPRYLRDYSGRAYLPGARLKSVQGQVRELVRQERQQDGGAQRRRFLEPPSEPRQLDWLQNAVTA